MIGILRIFNEQNHMHNHVSDIHTESTSEIYIESDQDFARKQQRIKLTPRGKEVFDFILKGLSDVTIGKCLSITYSGVRRHREKMLLQNNCSSMLELIAKYYGT